MPTFLLTTPPTQTVWLMVVAGGATILYAVFRPILKKKDPLSRSPNSSSLAQQRNVERQMQNLLVELSEMARQLTAQLDTRSAKLESLLQEADAKIAELRSASHQPMEFKPTTPPPPIWQPVNEPEPEPEPQHREVYALADQGLPAADIARELNRPRGEIELILALRSRAGKV